MHVFLGIYHKGVDRWKAFIAFTPVYSTSLHAVIKALTGNFESIDYNDENIIRYFVVYFHSVTTL